MPSSLKQGYASEWPLANARERVVLSLLDNMLAGIGERARRRVERDPRAPLADRLLARARLEARLVGLGAGSSELVEGRYSGLGDAFDIAILVDSRSCCWVEVTGVCCEAELEAKESELGWSGKGHMYCVGTWKLEKARKYGVSSRVWYAFVVGDIGKVRFIRASLLDAISRAGPPRALQAVLRRGENESVCVDERNWMGPRRFRDRLESALRRFTIQTQIQG